jgi:hypothetical protein
MSGKRAVPHVFHRASRKSLPKVIRSDRLTVTEYFFDRRYCVKRVNETVTCVWQYARPFPSASIAFAVRAYLVESLETRTVSRETLPGFMRDPASLIAEIPDGPHTSADFHEAVKRIEKLRRSDVPKK